MAQKLYVESLSRPLSKQQILSGTNACEHTFVRVHPSNKGTSPADSETHSILSTCCSGVCQGPTAGTRAIGSEGYSALCSTWAWPLILVGTAVPDITGEAVWCTPASALSLPPTRECSCGGDCANAGEGHAGGTCQPCDLLRTWQRRSLAGWWRSQSPLPDRQHLCWRVCPSGACNPSPAV
jgi:hypothetical protein